MPKLHDSEASRFQHSVWLELAGQNLSLTVKTVFLYLCHNPKSHPSGLFKLNFYEIMLYLEISAQDLEDSIAVLESKGWLVRDLELIYIPYVAQEQLFSPDDDRYWKMKVKKSLTYQFEPTSGGGNTTSNKAFSQWLNDHLGIVSRNLKECQTTNQAELKLKEVLLPDKTENGEYSPPEKHKNVVNISQIK